MTIKTVDSITLILRMIHTVLNFSFVAEVGLDDIYGPFGNGYHHFAFNEAYFYRDEYLVLRAVDFGMLAQEFGEVDLCDFRAAYR